ncbi:Uu.00g116900.m01.CDS01 [Anthostomella pinea]|uniref:Uu.00g116900.m01.CDS01 n=1 Tax=Anthostomella pinea TaxID=933095 RepID=A0AAI8VGM5_9PEZI|nr:Uu.00g116900.m01.CDS01 [Anthostomella pinea]
MGRKNRPAAPADTRPSDHGHFPAAPNRQHNQRASTGTGQDVREQLWWDPSTKTFHVDSTLTHYARELGDINVVAYRARDMPLPQQVPGGLWNRAGSRIVRPFRDLHLIFISSAKTSEQWSWLGER